MRPDCLDLSIEGPPCGCSTRNPSPWLQRPWVELMSMSIVSGVSGGFDLRRGPPAGAALPPGHLPPGHLPSGHLGSVRGYVGSGRIWGCGALSVEMSEHHGMSSARVWAPFVHDPVLMLALLLCPLGPYWGRRRRCHCATRDPSWWASSCKVGLGYVARRVDARLSMAYGAHVVHMQCVCR